ncbi:glycosyl hydrolase family 3 C-terminal domain-containing protein [Talaromyces proteolyticus]|uniref:beta-glucosidase n=1 Tax=Talaromyces proteolyticus TaxID=1131652 RepID=A0AAD4KRT0_9EURO|nr:glycosyl hydrolase family 3 C-terminal domain-containing protein [Talaromyces proteolyticus]KAH8697819.1 glycosyl hydrolase family 3 C-terminal domain-containing protein [Talaromyces proteolyticus]
MTSYNIVNGVHADEDSYLQDILRVPEHVLDPRVRTILETISLVADFGIPEKAEEKHFDRFAEKLPQYPPLRKDRSIAVIGPNSNYAQCCGGRSASMDTAYMVTPIDGIRVNAKTGTLRKADGRDGGPRFFFRVYYEPTEAEQRELTEELHLTQSEGFLMDYVDSRFRTYDFYQLIVDNATKQTPGTFFFGSVEFRFESSFTSNFERRGAVVFGPGGFWFVGCRRLVPQQAISDAVAVASASDQTVIVVSLIGEWESEGYDRQTMDLLPHNYELVEKVLKPCPNAVVVVQSGTTVTWAHKAHALFQAWNGGNEVWNWIADVLLEISIHPESSSLDSLLNSHQFHHTSISGAKRLGYSMERVSILPPQLQALRFKSQLFW